MKCYSVLLNGLRIGRVNAATATEAKRKAEVKFLEQIRAAHYGRIEVYEV